MDSGWAAHFASEMTFPERNLESKVGDGGNYSGGCVQDATPWEQHLGQHVLTTTVNDVVARWHTDLRYVIRIFVTDLSKVKEIARLASRLFQNAEFYNIHGNLMMCDLPIIFNYNTRVVGGRGGGV